MLAALAAKSWFHTEVTPSESDFLALVEATPGIDGNLDALAWLAASAVYADHKTSTEIPVRLQAVLATLSSVTPSAWADVAKQTVQHLQAHIDTAFLTNVPKGTNDTTSLGDYLFQHASKTGPFQKALTGLAADLVLSMAYTGKNDLMQSGRGQSLLLQHPLHAIDPVVMNPRMDAVLDSLPEDPHVLAQLLVVAGRWGMALLNNPAIDSSPSAQRAVALLGEHSALVGASFDTWGRIHLQQALASIVGQGKAMAQEGRLNEAWPTPSKASKPRL